MVLEPQSHPKPSKGLQGDMGSLLAVSEIRARTAGRLPEVSADCCLRWRRRWKCRNGVLLCGPPGTDKPKETQVNLAEACNLQVSFSQEHERVIPYSILHHACRDRVVGVLRAFVSASS